MKWSEVILWRKSIFKEYFRFRLDSKGILGIVHPKKDSNFRFQLLILVGLSNYYFAIPKYSKLKVEIFVFIRNSDLRFGDYSVDITSISWHFFIKQFKISIIFHCSVHPKIGNPSTIYKIIIELSTVQMLRILMHTRKHIFSHLHLFCMTNNAVWEVNNETESGETTGNSWLLPTSPRYFWE